MKNISITTTLLLLATSLSLTGQTFTYNFSIGDLLFVGGVSDFGVSQSDQHNFTFDNRNLQSPLNTQEHAQYISGFNPSDDLFMYMKKKIIGLQPNTTYKVTFIVEFASHYPTNAIGVGGPPGEGVTMKAGLTLIEPDTMITDEYVVMNIDKGNQSLPGVDMDTIGHVGVTDTTTVWTLKTNDNISHPFTFTTDSEGSAWLIIGTDSGFESTTELYYTQVIAHFDVFTGVADDLKRDDISIYPNPSSGSVHVSSSGGNIYLIRIYDMSGRLFRSYQPNTSEINFDLPSSEYLLKISAGDSTVVEKVIVQ